MKGPRISLEPGAKRSSPQSALGHPPHSVVPLRSRRRPRTPSSRPARRAPYHSLREGLTLFGWGALILSWGFVAAAQPPSTYAFFARMGHTRTAWDPTALEVAFVASLLGALGSLVAVGLPGRVQDIRPRLWSAFILACLTSGALALR